MKDREMTSIFERYLTVWIILCIGCGIMLGKLAPELSHKLDGMAIHVNGAPVISIPIAICLFLMMYPIMVKIDFNSVIKAGGDDGLTLVMVAINSLTMLILYGILGGFLLGVPVMLMLVKICLRTQKWFASPEQVNNP